MIVGSGLLARAFEPSFGRNPHVVIFASGVSNSLETRSVEFEREKALLQHSLSDEKKRLVYFSSCGVTAADAELSLYMQHKRSMETLVLNSSGGLVLRLPQVVGKTDNPHTLTNFLRDHIVSGEHFTVWARAERNLIDIDDIVKIVVGLAGELPTRETISIAATQSSPMIRIVEIFEHVLGKVANYSLVEKGSSMTIDTTLVESLSANLGINLGSGYIERLVSKYYGPGDHASAPTAPSAG